MSRVGYVRLAALGAAMCLTGCVPAAFTVVPQISGRVVSCCGAPLPDAVVAIAPAEGHDAPSRRVDPDRRGRFQRAEERQWRLGLLVPAHAMGTPYTATAHHELRSSEPRPFGGRYLAQQFFGITNRTERYDLGDLIICVCPCASSDATKP